MAAPRQAPAPATKARCARETRDSRRDAAPPAGSGRRGRRSTTPRATRPRPRPAAAARRERMRADPRSGATDRCRGQSATAGARSRRTPPARRARRRRRARPAQTCPSPESCRRARAPWCPTPSAVRRVLARRRRGGGSHLGAVRLLQVRDLPRTGLCRHRRRGRGRAPRRSPTANQFADPAGRRGGRGHRPTRPCDHHRHARRPGPARAGGKLRMGLGSCHGYRPCPRRPDYDLVERPGRGEMTTQVATAGVKDSPAGSQQWVYGLPRARARCATSWAARARAWPR